MKKICVVALMLLAATTCRGEDLSGFGLSGLKNVSDAEAMDVRGRGLDSKITSLATNSMAFTIVDTTSGSVFNLNATSQMTGLDSMLSDLDSVDSGVQSIGLTNTGGVQFGSSTFSIGDSFRFNMEGFSSVGQTTQIGGAAFGVDFQGLLSN